MIGEEKLEDFKKKIDSEVATLTKLINNFTKKILSLENIFTTLSDTLESDFSLISAQISTLSTLSNLFQISAQPMESSLIYNLQDPLYPYLDELFRGSGEGIRDEKIGEKGIVFKAKLEQRYHKFVRAANQQYNDKLNEIQSALLSLSAAESTLATKIIQIKDEDPMADRKREEVHAMIKSIKDTVTKLIPLI